MLDGVHERTDGLIFERGGATVPKLRLSIHPVHRDGCASRAFLLADAG